MANPKFLQFTIFLAILSTFVQSQEQTNSRKLDETTPDLQNKCGSCPCNNPCNPPSPPPPSPPPPSPPLLPPPPPQKKQPPSTDCPPPPSGGGSGGGGGGQYVPSPPYLFINGPPGNLYPVDPYYSNSGRSFSVGPLPFLVITLLGLIAFW